MIDSTTGGKMSFAEQEARSEALKAASAAIVWEVVLIPIFVLAVGTVFAVTAHDGDGLLMFGVGAALAALLGAYRWNVVKMRVMDLRRRHEYMDRT